MAFDDALLGLRALFLESREWKGERAALLDLRAPGLTPAERDGLLSIPEDRLDVYVGMLRENQLSTLQFVAPSTVEVLERFAGVAPAEVARATLVESPRRTARMRELSARLLDHLRGPGAAWTARCPAVLDLARFEAVNVEVFYAPDDPDAMTPPAFAARVSEASVEDALRLVAKPTASVRVLAIDHDVLTWREARFEADAWGDPPPRLAQPLEIVGARDPGTLQAAWHRTDAPLIDLLRPLAEGRGWDPLETWAERWVDATGTAPDDPEAAARFFEQIASWVGHGLLAVREPG